jgi:hypothetical protein
VSKQRMHKFFTERFSRKKINKVEGKEQLYHVEILKWFAAFVNLNFKVNIYRAWETVYNFQLGRV